MKEYICAIDIGSTVTRVIVARPLQDEAVEVLGVGTAPSYGVRTGSIVNIEQTIQSLSEASREAELMSGLLVDEALLGISGKHLHGDNSRGVVAITNKDRIVREEDVLRVIEGAQNVRMPLDQEMIHVLSREFRVDDQEGIKDPVGMTGVRLEAEVHIVSAGVSAISNLEKAISGAGIRISGGVMSSLASAEAILNPGEKDMGVAVIDIGGGVCDIIVYSEGGVCQSFVLPLGAIHVTQDLSIGLRAPMEVAEMIKKTYGAALSAIVDPTEKIELPGMPGRASRMILRQDISAIIEARMKEIFELADVELKKSGRKGDLAGGVVLTGGGSQIEGLRELAEDVFAATASIAAPTNVSGFVERVSGPEFATVLGMIHYTGRIAANDRSLFVSETGGNIWERVKVWIGENF